MWALDEFTVENGATRVVVGSHNRMDIPEVDEEDVASAVMSSGSVLYYLGSTIHGGGANHSTAPRAGLINTYSLGWLRQEENQYLAHPPEVAEDFPEPLRRLIGYNYGGSYLGFFNGDDPHRIFEPGYDGPAMRSTPA